MDKRTKNLTKTSKARILGKKKTPKRYERDYGDKPKGKNFPDGPTRKLSIQRFTARAPFGDKVYATLKFVSAANLSPSVGTLGLFGTQIVYNDLSAYVGIFGLAPGLTDYSNIFLDYRVLRTTFVIDYFPSTNADAAQVMFGWQGQLPLPNLNYKEVLEKNFFSYKNVQTSGSGTPTRMKYTCDVRNIDPAVVVKTLDYSGQTLTVSPYATVPTEIARFACGMVSVAPAGYPVATSQGTMLVTAYVQVCYWNRRQQSHV